MFRPNWPSYKEPATAAGTFLLVLRCSHVTGWVSWLNISCSCVCGSLRYVRFTESDTYCLLVGHRFLSSFLVRLTCAPATACCDIALLFLCSFCSIHLSLSLPPHLCPHLIPVYIYRSLYMLLVPFLTE
jgi:hypothetical protein